MSDGEAGASGSSEPEVVDLEPAVTAVVRGVVPVGELRGFFDASFGALARVVEAQGIALVSPALGLYHGAPALGGALDLEVGFVTDRAVRAEGGVVVGSLPGGRVAWLTHFGAFDELGASWGRLHSWIRARGLTAGADRWEVYVTRPSPDMDPRDLRTELNWPVIG